MDFSCNSLKNDIGRSKNSYYRDKDCLGQILNGTVDWFSQAGQDTAQFFVNTVEGVGNIFISLGELTGDSAKEVVKCFNILSECCGERGNGPRAPTEDEVKTIEERLVNLDEKQYRRFNKYLDANDLKLKYNRNQDKFNLVHDTNLIRQDDGTWDYNSSMEGKEVSFHLLLGAFTSAYGKGGG